MASRCVSTARKLCPRRGVTLSLPEKLRHPDVEHPVPEPNTAFTADPGYSALISAEPDRWDKAFRFVDGVCEFHLYTNGVEEDPIHPARGCRSGADQRVEENLL